MDDLRNNITQEFVKSILDYDCETGKFKWKEKRTGKALKDSEAGFYNSLGYIEISILNKSYKAHRIAWLYTHGNWPEFEIDHINGVRDDNRIENLRDVTKSENQQNKRNPHGKNTHIGCHFNISKNKWQARITINGKRKHIGWFDTSEDAFEAYKQSKRINHAGCTI